MLAFKCAAKVAASQICINLPTDSLEALNPLSDSLFSDAFDMACNVFTPEEEEEDAEEVLEKAKKGDVPPEETLNLLMKDNGYKDARCVSLSVVCVIKADPFVCCVTASWSTRT